MHICHSLKNHPNVHKECIHKENRYGILMLCHVSWMADDDAVMQWQRYTNQTRQRHKISFHMYMFQLLVSGAQIFTYVKFNNVTGWSLFYFPL